MFLRAQILLAISSMLIGSAAVKREGRARFADSRKSSARNSLLSPSGKPLTLYSAHCLKLLSRTLFVASQGLHRHVLLAQLHAKPGEYWASTRVCRKTKLFADTERRLYVGRCGSCCKRRAQAGFREADNLACQLMLNRRKLLQCRRLSVCLLLLIDLQSPRRAVRANF